MHTHRELLLSKLQKAVLKNTRERRTLLTPNGDMVQWMFDFRPLLLDSEILPHIRDAAWEYISPFLPCSIGGIESASIPLITSLILKATESNASLKGFYLRKSRKTYGSQQRVEGTIGEDAIVLVDDILNSGGSFRKQVEILEEMGKKVTAIFALVRFRDDSEYTYFAEKGIRVLSLYTLDDFPETGGMREKKDVQPEARRTYTALWRFESAKPDFFHANPKSTPAIDASRLYFGADNGTFWALNQNDGSVAWQYKTQYGARVGGTEKRIFSSPAIAQNTIFFGAYDGNVYALDSKSGEKEWVYRDADWIGSSPCVSESEGLVYIGLEFGLWKKRGGIAALDIKTGEKKWWHNTPSLTHASPCYVRSINAVLVGSNAGDVYCYDAKNGSLRWTYKTDGSVKGSIICHNELGYACFGSFDRHVHCVDMHSGNRIFMIETGDALYTTPIILGTRLYIGSTDKNLYCIELKERKTLWKFEALGRFFAQPLLVDDSLFIGATNGILYEIDTLTGKERSHQQFTERILNAAVYNPKTRTLFVPTQANEIYALTLSETSSLLER